MGSTEASLHQPVDEQALSYADVGQCHALLLGEPPKNLPLPTGGMPGLLSQILASSAFRQEVLSPVMLRQPFPAGRFKDAPPLALIFWAQDRLPLRPATRVRIGLARDWHSLLEALLADPGLLQWNRGLVEAGIGATLEDRLVRDPRFKASHAVVGAIDTASAFEIRGWARDTCHPGKPLSLKIYADGVFIGAATCDQPRPDVADIVGGSGDVGFGFTISAAHRRSFIAGCKLSVRDALLGQLIGQEISVHNDAAHMLDHVAAARHELKRLREAIERVEAQLPDLSRMASMPLDAYDEYWERLYRPTAAALLEQSRAADQLAYRPTISVVIPAYCSPQRWLDEAIESVRAQTWPEWELIISDDASPDSSTMQVLERRYAHDRRIRWIRGETQGGIAVNTNRALAACRGDLVAFVDHDDRLAPDALFHVVSAWQNQDIDWLYSDEDRIEEDATGRLVHHSPFFKPAFDPDLLLGMNYICHLVVVRRELLEVVGGLQAGCDGAQDHDLLLRLAECTVPERIGHIARVLYHWRVTPGSVSQDTQRQASLKQTIADVVDAHLRRRGEDVVVKPHDDAAGKARLFANRVRWRLPESAPTVSIIVPTRDRLELLQPCVRSVLQHADQYPGVTDLIVVDNESQDPATRDYLQALGTDPRVRVIHHVGAFNFSAINNTAARQAQGEVLIFLNNDTQILTPDWCSELVSHALRPDVGAVGARLLYQDGTLQHGGVLLGVEGVAGHEGVGDSPLEAGYYGRSQLLRSAGAVTAACLATRREVFLGLDGGFDELHLQVAFNDVDYCMRVRRAGLRVVYTPFATLYHYESKSRGREISATQQERFRNEARAFCARWGESVTRDPYYNLHFERQARPFARLRPPPVLSTAGQASPAHLRT